MSMLASNEDAAMYQLRKAVLENEQLFQKMNLQIQREAQDLAPLDLPRDLMMALYCECADPECEERISLALETYRELILHSAEYKGGHLFLVKPMHIFPRYEEVLRKFRDYWVVQKPPAGGLSAPEP